jgi:hypothetical protein
MALRPRLAPGLPLSVSVLSKRSASIPSESTDGYTADGNLLPPSPVRFYYSRLPGLSIALQRAYNNLIELQGADDTRTEAWICLGEGAIAHVLRRNTAAIACQGSRRTSG